MAQKILVAPMGINIPSTFAKTTVKSSNALRNALNPGLAAGGTVASQASSQAMQALKNTVAPGHTHDATTSLDSSWFPNETALDKPADIMSGGDGGNGGNGGSGGGVGLQAAPVQTDPYAGIYSIYEQQLNAQRDALAQQRQARLNALQANYNNAKSRLDSSFNQGETELNQNADRALREAYIDNMLNQRALNQQLAGQGIIGGAAESVLARAYNDYGNNRNEIERNRMDNLRSLLGNYQGTLGDIENSYLAGMADADSDYSGSIADAMTNYYDRLANMQAQNAASQYRTALGKSGSSSSGSSGESGLNKDILNVGKANKTNPSAYKRYLDEAGVPEEQQREYLWAVGIDPDSAAMLPQTTRNAILDELENAYASARSNNNPYADNIINQRMQQLVRQFGLTEAQARELLAEAGF